MKVIFLDIDGVIALGNHKLKATKWGNVYKFDKKAVLVLNEILEQTNAEIVLSSDWKGQHSLQDMREIFDWNMVKKGPISFTINSAEYAKAVKDDDLYLGRAFEIKDYVDRHKLTYWVAIDDLKLDESIYSETFIGHFVYCGKSNEGIKQCNNKELILNILNNG